MKDQPKAWIIATLNRVFEESEERTPDGAAKLRSSLIRCIAREYDQNEIMEVLNAMATDKLLQITAAPFASDCEHCAIMRGYIPSSWRKERHDFLSR